MINRKRKRSEINLDVTTNFRSVCIHDDRKRRRMSASSTPRCLQTNGHIFQGIFHPQKLKKNSQRRCRVYAKHTQKRKKRSENTWECKKCLTTLHIENCFEIFHTVQYY
ncbi:hypothetical protein ANTRET_LOCUS4142 [Anthophora retusa]